MSVFTNFWEKGEGSGEDVCCGKLDQEVVHPRELLQKRNFYLEFFSSDRSSCSYDAQLYIYRAATLRDFEHLCHNIKSSSFFWEGIKN